MSPTSYQTAPPRVAAGNGTSRSRYRKQPNVVGWGAENGLAAGHGPFVEADDVVDGVAGDLATYQAKIRDAQAKVDQARQAGNQSATPTTTTTPNQA